MGLFDSFTAQGRRDAFAKRAIGRLAEMGWPHPVAYDADAFVLDLGGEAGEVSLGAIFQDWSRYPRREQAAALDQALAFVFDLEPPPGFDEARPLLVPTVRGRAVTEAMLCEPSDDPQKTVGDAWRPFGEHLAIGVAVDRPNSLLFVNASVLQDWGCSFDQALEIALANLRGREPPVFERHELGFHVSDAKDFNAIARLLTPEVFASIPLRGAPVVVAASRECLMLAGEEDTAAIECMARFTPQFLDRHPRPISFAPMILQEGEWRPYNPPPGLPGAQALHRLQKAHDYEQQLPLILGRLVREGRPEAVGQFLLLPTEDGARSVTLWIEPSCLLPRADMIVLRTGKGATLVRAWEDVEAACGGLPLEPKTASPYHVVTACPDAQAMERIAAAPEPEWAKGRGIGVANGRLTIFG